VSVDPLFDLAAIETAAGDRIAAHHALDRAVRRQPANPQTWLRLAEFDLTVLGNAEAALNNLRPALYLDPRSYQVEGEVLTVLRSLAVPASARRPAATGTRGSGAGAAGVASAGAPGTATP
jgi:tetratricopeptide (TPR) repeat protein